MILDPQNITCILCNKPLKHDVECRYKCECRKTVITHTKHEQSSCTLFVDCLYFNFSNYYLDNPKIKVGNSYYDLHRKEQISLFNNKNLFEILKDEINKPDYSDLKYLSDFYNSIKKYFIAYKNNMVFL